MQKLIEQPPKMVKGYYLDKLIQKMSVYDSNIKGIGIQLQNKINELATETETDLLNAFGKVDSKEQKEMILIYLIQDINNESQNLTNEKVNNWFKDQLNKLYNNQF